MQQAGSTAEGLLARDPYHGSVEVWSATRRVMKLERDCGTASPADAPPCRGRDRTLGSVRLTARRIARPALTWAAATDTKFPTTKN